MRMRNMLRPKNGEHMFSDWETCIAEVRTMKGNGTLKELRTESGELAVQTEHGLVPSHYKDHPLIYAALQTPTLKAKILREGNLAIHFDTQEPRIVFHATPVDIPVEEGLRPKLERSGGVNITTRKKGMVARFRDRFNLHPLENYGLWFASIAETTKIKAAASTRTADADHVIYPCFIFLKNPRVIDYDKDKHLRGQILGSSGGSRKAGEDGIIRIYSRSRENYDYSVKSPDQVIHIPLNMFGVYKR